MPRATSVFVFRPALETGGADRVTLTLLRELDRDLVRLTLVLLRPQGRLLAELPPDVRLVTLGARRLRTSWWRLARLLRREAPDVLFSTSSGGNLAAALAHLVAGSRCRLVLSERSTLRRHRWRVRLLKRLLYRRADRIAVVSRGVAEDLARELGLPAGRLRVVYNPLVGPELAEGAREAPDHPWFDGGSPVLLAAGRLVPEKGFDLLVDALARVRDRHDARLVILGEGRERRALLERAARRGIAPHLDLPGHVDNPFKYMSRCTVFVLSSRFEGLPGVLIQAMACGAPVVAADCPHGPAEIIEPGGDGLLVPAGDPGALATAIGRLLDEPETRARLGRQARISGARFSVPSAVERYLAALREWPA